MGKPPKGGNGGSDTITGNKRDNVLIGTSANEILNGKGGDDRLFGAGGDDTILGGSGIDTAVYAFSRDAYDVTLLSDGSIQIAGPEGTDILTDVEFFEFADITQDAAQVILPRQANLSVSTLDVGDTLLSPGETTSVSLTISSDGAIDAGGSAAELFYATAPNETAIVGSLGTVDLAALASGASETVTLALAPGTLEPGTYWVAVRADAGGTVDESDETDNLTDWVEITVEAPVADLRLNAATVGSGSDLALEGGAQIDIVYDIENLSNTDVSYFSVATYLSTDATISGDDMRIAGATGGTYPGLTSAFTVSHYLPESFAAGDYYLISVVGWGDGTADATPEDNLLLQTVTLTPPPPPTIDLAVNEVRIAATSDLDLGPNGYVYDGDGALLDLEIDLSNFGTGDVFGAGLTAYLSTDGTVSAEDTAIWSGQVDLLSDATTTLFVSANVGALVAAGDYQVIVVADAPNDIDAANDSANAAVTLIGSLDPDAGTQGDDVWISGPGSDVVSLLGGNDLAIAGAGNDRVDGGDGFDTIDFSAATEGMDLYFGSYEGYDLASAPSSTQMPFSTWVNFEAVVMSSYDDYVSLAGSGVNQIDLGAGNDVGEGSFGNDIIDAGAGDDFVSGLFGDDIIFVGDGADIYAVARDSTSGTVTGFGNDVIEDFDVLADALLISIGVGDGYDPFDDLTQTSEGALLSYAGDSSILLSGVSVGDLNAFHFNVIEDGGTLFG